MAEGHEGWDEYAPFYDWENARTLGRRDVPFWRKLALDVKGPVLELGCGTGRIAMPLGRAGVPVIGIDRSEAMLTRARRRVARGRLQRRVRLIRGDIRHLPFASSSFGMVMAP
jgi:ubiquinone/menaquinone biosynthesis C-methylase UbiE